MRRLQIDFISPEDIRIYIDDTRIENVAKFWITIEQGRGAKFGTEGNFLPPEEKQEKKEEIKAKWRTIPEAAKEFKKEDPNTTITEHYIRQLVQNGEIGVIQNGTQQRVDLEEIKRYLKELAKKNKQKNEKNVSKLKAIY